MVLLSLLAVMAAAGKPACDLTQSGDTYCASFCAGECGFYNSTIGGAGDRGEPFNMTVYRITPANVTGLLNKNSADAPGDISFVISKKNLTQQCLHAPQSIGCQTDQEGLDLYGEHRVEVDGLWGPYQLCNPALGWDTSTWWCGPECFQPTEAGCNKPFRPPVNGTGFNGDPLCWCERTAKAVGREQAPSPAMYGPSFSFPPGYAKQCVGTFKPFAADATAGACIDGGSGVAPYKVLQAWSLPSASSMACQACYDDKACTGWRTLDNVTAQLFDTPLRNASTPAGATCAGAAKITDTGYGPPGANWYGLANLGGCEPGKGCSNTWFSTPTEGQCAPGAPLGTDGCSWRLVETLKVRAACPSAPAP